MKQTKLNLSHIFTIACFSVIFTYASVASYAVEGGGVGGGKPEGSGVGGGGKNLRQNKTSKKKMKTPSSAKKSQNRLPAKQGSIFPTVM